jgi:hypothetical protein
MVVVDYLNLMLSDRSSSGDSLYVKIKTISEDLRALSVYFMVPIVTATQLNRAGYNVKPAENNIAECIALMATADIIIALYQMDTDKDADIIRSIFIKNRYGPKQKEFIHSICFAYMRILDGVTVSPTLAVPDQSNFGKLFGNEMALATLMNLEPQAPAVPPVNNVQQS